MSNPWTKLVQEKFRLGRLTNPSFSLGQAMQSAKKVYKTGVSASATVAKTLKGKRNQRRQTHKRKPTRGGAKK
jgi:hypothetical protein